MSTPTSGIAVLISGRGSNLRAILESPAGAHVSAVLSDNPDAAGLRVAAAGGKDAFIVAPEDFSAASEWADKLAETLAAVAPKIVALAGFMRILPPPLVRALAGRAVNIHPSLLPQFPGLNTHARALAAGAREHGCTAHYVSEKVDGGEIIARRKVPVLPGDDAESLAARVLAAEHKLYPQVLLELLKK
ncbi:MAG: phosphoribosylglycinamide formyltransferase [Betaproteobacteria bacterium]|nr:phosphoribosylglycinamide formyltransferase [Betaproteobacteria bacterium]